MGTIIELAAFSIYLEAITVFSFTWNLLQPAQRVTTICLWLWCVITCIPALGSLRFLWRLRRIGKKQAAATAGCHVRLQGHETLPCFRYWELTHWLTSLILSGISVALLYKCCISQTPTWYSWGSKPFPKPKEKGRSYVYVCCSQYV